MDVAILGADSRGRDVTRHCVRAGHTVRLHDQDANTVMDSVDAVDHELPGSDVTEHVTGTTGLASAVDGADIVVEMAGGDTDARRELVAEVETLVADDTPIAMGVAAGSVTAVAAGLRAPSRSIGLKFSGATDGTLVEVVLADQTTASTRDRAVTFVESLDCTPIVVADTPGTATLRLELAVIGEAIRMAQAGVASVPDIDRAMTHSTSGSRGPLARADELGLERVLAGLEELTVRLGERFEPPALLEQAVADGRHGRQSGEGFYVWTDDEPTTPSDLTPDGPTVADESDNR